MSDRDREEWMRDLETSQRNTLFPDTVENEARFWRALRRNGLTFTQLLGVVLLAVVASTIICLGVKDVWTRVPRSDGFLHHAFVAFFDWIVVFALLGFLFLLMRHSLRKLLK